MTSKQTPFGTLSYTYDSAGDLLTLASSNTNGASLTYTYDKLNRLSTVTDNRLLAQGAASGATTYNYDEVGNLQNFTYPNGVTHAYTYDTLNRLTQLCVGTAAPGCAGGQKLASYVYTLGAAGNRTSVAELTGRTVGYVYDSLYRLTSETVSADPNNHNGAISYTYDNVGNRKTLTSTLAPVGGNTYSYDADDRLASDGYDPNGNTTNSSGIGGWPILSVSHPQEVAPPFPRLWREGGLSPRARRPSVLASARSIAIRSRQSLPPRLHSEQSCLISSPLASPPVLSSLDCDGCSGASRSVSLRSIPENRSSGPARIAGDPWRAAFVT